MVIASLDMQKGDVIRIHFDMPVRTVVANGKVADDKAVLQDILLPFMPAEPTCSQYSIQVCNQAASSPSPQR